MKKLTIDNHKHEYVGGNVHDHPECIHCGLLKSTIENSTMEKITAENQPEEYKYNLSNTVENHSVKASKKVDKKQNFDKELIKIITTIYEIGVNDGASETFYYPRLPGFYADKVKSLCLQTIKNSMPEKGLLNHALQQEKDRYYSKGFNTCIDEFFQNLKREFGLEVK